MNIFLFDSENNIDLNYLFNPAFKITTTKNYTTAYDLIEKNYFNLFLINLPSEDSNWIKLINQIKSKSYNPILTFSSYNENTNFSLLTLGVTWNLEKNISPNHLNGIINYYNSKIYRLKNFSFSSELMCLWTNNKPKPLTRKEVIILETLIKRRNHIVHRDTLHNLMYQYNDDKQLSIDFHITNIRNKLGAHRKHLQTSYGSGYIWVEIL